jgi:outer membrane protein assembly factor BamB
VTSPQRFLTIVFAVAIAAPAGAQAPKELWDQRYDGPSHQWDEAVKVAADGGGNVFVTGLSGEPNGFDFARYTAKYAAANGMLLWEKRHRSKGANSEWGADLAVDSAGNVVVTGVAEFGDSEPGRDYLTAKYAGVNGALLWQHRYNGPANYNDEAYSVAVDDAGNVIVTGFSWTTDQTYSAYTAKYAAANGGLLWERRGPYASQCFKVVVDGQGNAIVAGLGGFDSPFYTAKYAAA